jgi:hypothetical protein
MLELELRRNEQEHLLFELDGFGTVRMLGRLGSEVVAEAPGHGEWHFKPPALADEVRATDAAGTLVAVFNARTMTHGDRTLRFEQRKAGFFRTAGPHVLLDGDHELLRVGWRSPPTVDVTIVDEDAARAEPLLVLFAIWMTIARLDATSAWAPSP